MTLCVKNATNSFEIKQISTSSPPHIHLISASSPFIPVLYYLYTGFTYISSSCLVLPSFNITPANHLLPNLYRAGKKEGRADAPPFTLLVIVNRFHVQLAI